VRKRRRKEREKSTHHIVSQTWGHWSIFPLPHPHDFQNISHRFFSLTKWVLKRF
jgi:hypothetical protein